MVAQGLIMEVSLNIESVSNMDFETLNKFRSEVIDGLESSPKRLLSKYFYDERGDALFQQIMNMPEYYLTNCEWEIFKQKKEELAKIINAFHEPFDLIELGAGDATKSSHLLKYLVNHEAKFTYMPIDISGNILKELENNLKYEIPELKVVPLEGEYFEMLDRAASLSRRRKVVMFLGSNIGNMEIEEAHVFCGELNKKLSTGDLLLIGFDLKKNPQTILNAYNDNTGITAAFNLNLLLRINRELGANFNLKQFQHFQTYDPITGACRSFLISLTNQKITIGRKVISFSENEYINMEISQKFSEREIVEMANKVGFQSIGVLKDIKGWFVDVIWQVR